MLDGANAKDVPSTPARVEPPRCAYCGTQLVPLSSKCASCGAPVPSATRRRSTGRTTVAGFLLFALLILTVVQGILAVADPAKTLNPGVGLEDRDLTIQGRVMTDSGNPIVNATVRVVSPSEQASETTDAEGRYRLSGLPAGFLVIRFEAADFGRTDLRMFLASDREVDVTLLQEPGERVVNHGSYSRVAGIATGCGFLLFGVAVLLLAGALAAYRRRNYRLALWAGVVGMVGSLPVSLLLGLLAVVLVAKSRDEFS